MLRALLSLAALAAAAANEGVVCMASPAKKTLLCSALPAPGPLAVYAEGEAPYHAEQMHLLSDGSLCEAAPAGRGRCASPAHRGIKFAARIDTRSFLTKLTAAASSVHGQRLMLGAFVITAAVLLLPALLALRTSGGAAGARKTTFVEGLLHLAGSWWFPWLAATGTAVNMFTLIFTAATVVMFLAALLAKPSRWWGTAVLNAAGAAVGSALLIGLVKAQGDSFIADTFPSLLASSAWAKTMGWMETYGVAGMFLVSSLPLILHPVIFFGLLSGMGSLEILAIIFFGRVVKYTLMGWITVHAPHALRFFGVKASLFELASSAVKKE